MDKTANKATNKYRTNLIPKRVRIKIITLKKSLCNSIKKRLEDLTNLQAFTLPLDEIFCKQKHTYFSLFEHKPVLKKYLHDLTFL